jgi:DCN1-like protein 1/2
MKYFGAVGAELDDVASLVVSEIVQCPTMGEITREGFVNGWSELGGDTIERQKAILTSRRANLNSVNLRDRDILKKIYKHTFKLGITGAGQRSVDKETCIEMWKLIFSPPSFNWSTKSTDWLALWLEFVAGNSVKGINSDVWNQTFKFAEESIRDESLTWWSEEAAWPALVDEFVEWIKAKRGVGREEEMEDMDY